MDTENHDNSFTILDNKAIGRNIARVRKFKEKKALEVADYIGIGEAAYTKYERGESRLTVELIQKVSEFLEVDPLYLMVPQNGHIVENSNSPNSVVALNSSNWQTTNEQQNQAILTLINHVTEMSKRVVELLEKGREGNN
jgi:transcriptional regulator with XRE-family HTH domain